MEHDIRHPILHQPQLPMKPFATRLSLLTLAAIAAFATQAPALETTTPVAAKTNSEQWWNGNCQRILSDLEKTGREIDVAFVGDSITARWRGNENWTKHWGAYKAVNMGIGGDKTQNVLWRLDHGQLDGYKAKLFVVMIGTNNLWDKTTTPEEVAAGVKAVLERIQAKQPQARILLMSILPTGEKPNPGRDKRMAVNPLIAKFAGGSVEYIDISGKYLDAEGRISKELMHDFLHLAPQGYDLWAEAIATKVKESVRH